MTVRFNMHHYSGSLPAYSVILHAVISTILETLIAVAFISWSLCGSNWSKKAP